MVLNLFLALLLNSFNSEELKNRKEVIFVQQKKKELMNYDYCRLDDCDSFYFVHENSLNIDAVL